MTPQFDYFIILAAMRTGSNLLEANLNAIEGVTGFGEAFNPHFIGRLKSESLLGVSVEQRDQDPALLLDAIRQAPGELNGFRFFQEHDPRVLETVLNDPRCAKIILTRNPLDSYVSLKIARETKQWQLKNIKRRRAVQVEFEAEAFVKYLNRQQEFHLTLSHRLQQSGQTAFYISYDDLSQLDILNGLAAWLGVSGRLSALDDTLKPQNPDPALAKVTNPEEMEQALSQIDSFNLHSAPNFEPRRRAYAGHYVATPETPLIYMPIHGGTKETVVQWMAQLDGVDVGQLLTNQNKRQTSQWFQDNPGHRKFTVLQHPLARAHYAFCKHILNTGPGVYPKIRHFLRNRLKIPIPGQLRDGNYPVEQHYEAFTAFLKFLRQNLALQTAVRVDAAWCSQSRALEGMASFALPDLILREDEITSALPDLARRLGHDAPPVPVAIDPDTPYPLAAIYDAALETLATEAYQRDYLQFGFEAWTPIRGEE